MQGHVDMAIQKSSRFSIVMIDFSNLLHLNFDLFTPVVFENIFYICLTHKFAKSSEFPVYSFKVSCRRLMVTGSRWRCLSLKDSIGQLQLSAAALLC